MFMSEKRTGKLSSPIDYSGLTFEEMLEEARIYFSDIFMKKGVRPKYNGKDIFFSMSSSSGMFDLGYPEKFLHITSLDDEDKYNVFPCTNDYAYEICDIMCGGPSSISFYSVLGRWECVYRLRRIHWIREIIDLANKRDPHITEWDVVEIDHERGKYNKRFIRYHYGIDDYVIILREDKKQYIFITAFPVVSKARKKEYDRQYNRYIKK